MLAELFLRRSRLPADYLAGEDVDGEGDVVPVQVATWVKSATRSRFGAPAVNWRFTRSAVRTPSGSWIVVRTVFAAHRAEQTQSTHQPLNPAAIDLDTFSAQLAYGGINRMP